jgi:hypothetical protein
MGKIDDICHGNYLGDVKSKLTKGSSLVARGSNQCCLCVTKTKLCNDVLDITNNDISIELQNKTLGHMSEKGM